MGIDLIAVIVVVASLATAFLSSIFGMLGGLILMGILVSLMQVGPAMILHGLIQMTSNGYRAWLNRKDINLKIVGTLFIGNVLAMVVLFFITSIFFARPRCSSFVSVKAKAPEREIKVAPVEMQRS